MKHFERIRENVEIEPILEELARQPDAWFEQTGRQKSSPAQLETTSIPIRGLQKSKTRGRRRRDVLETRYTKLSRRFPAVTSFIESFAGEQDAKLARAKIARLEGGGRVHPHIDRGDYYRRHDRYHLVLRSPQGSLLCAGGEEVRMRERELWWFDNKATHEAVNDDDVDRMHLIFDLAPRTGEALRGPQPFPTGLEDELRDLDARVSEARKVVRRHQSELVAQAVGLYLVGRETPSRWQDLLEESGALASGDDDRPLRATIRLLTPDASDAAVRRQGRAMVWALEQIESGALRWQEVADAILERGGVGAVARGWKREQVPAEKD